MTRRYLISGTVQGVGFRYAACQQAQNIGLSGWVRNLPDGRVEALATGTADTLSHFEDWLHNGPPGARVAGLQIMPGQQAADSADFEIRR
ncbi:MAG: acylphosphatase [Nevskiales bacterium]